MACPVGTCPPVAPVCSVLRRPACSYVLLCAPQSVVAQCKQQPALDSLRPSMQLFTAVRKLCGVGAPNAQAPPAAGPRGGRVGVAAQDLPPGPAATGDGNACSRCSSQSFDPNQVTVQAVQGNCPDPLGEPAQRVRRRPCRLLLCNVQLRCTGPASRSAACRGKYRKHASAACPLRPANRAGGPVRAPPRPGLPCRHAVGAVPGEQRELPGGGLRRMEGVLRG